MNKKNIIIIVTVSIIVLLALIFFPRNNNKTEPTEGTPIEVLNKSTQSDTTGEIENNLNIIDVKGSSTEDFKSVDADIKNL